MPKDRYLTPKLVFRTQLGDVLSPGPQQRSHQALFKFKKKIILTQSEQVGIRIVGIRIELDGLCIYNCFHLAITCALR